MLPPLSFESKPLIAFISVVLPAPEPPMMATNSFSPIFRLTSFNIVLPFPTFFVIWFTSTLTPDIVRKYRI